MQRFINRRDTIVSEALEGLAVLAPLDGGEALARLDGYPHIKVIVRPNPDPREVAIVSGGGAGHVTHEIAQSKLADRLELIVGPAPLMTSLDMNGFSLSLLPLDELRHAALTSPCAPLAWPAVRRLAPVEVRPLPPLTPRIDAPVGFQLRTGGRRRPSGSLLPSGTAPASSDARVEQALAAVLERCVALQGQLDELDAKIGDGDTGSTLATAARAIQAQFPILPFASPTLLLASLAEILAQSMGGSSGVLLSILCTAASEAFERRQGWAAALAEGVERMREYGGAQPGDRTMIDALVPGLETLLAGGDLERAAAAARQGAEQTASLSRAKAGRAAYLSADTLAGVCDPGAVAVAAAFEAVRDAGQMRRS
jgi:triose/dihydroxyacetone kinase / FAD-AMP lyase (cyclizing)